MAEPTPVAAMFVTWDHSHVSNPYGVAVASDGSVYVADAHTHRIQKFSVGP